MRGKGGGETIKQGPKKSRAQNAPPLLVVSEKETRKKIRGEEKCSVPEGGQVFRSGPKNFSKGNPTKMDEGQVQCSKLKD